MTRMEYLRYSLTFIPMFVYKFNEFLSLKFKVISHTHSFVSSTPGQPLDAFFQKINWYIDVISVFQTPWDDNDEESK